MSIARTSTLVPLGPKPTTSNYAGLVNSATSSVLSSTPSPVSTPISGQSIGSLKSFSLPPLSPAPSPLPVSSKLVASNLNTKTNTLPGLISSTPSPISSQGVSSGGRSSLSSLQPLPASPLALPALRNPQVGTFPLSQTVSSSNKLSPLPSLPGLANTPRSQGPVVSRSQAGSQSGSSSPSRLSSLPPAPRSQVGSKVGSQVGSQTLSQPRLPQPLSQPRLSPQPLSQLGSQVGSSSRLSPLPLPPTSQVGSSSRLSPLPLPPTSQVGSSSRLSPLPLPPTSQLGSSSRLSSRLSSVPRSDLSSVPRSDLSSVPRSDLSSVPRSDLSSVPRSDLSSVPRSDLSSVPRSDLSSVPRSDLSSVPRSDLSSVPRSDLSSVPRSDLSSFPEDFSAEPVEKSLLSKGWLPIDKIISEDDQGNLMCRYIKAVDPNGRTAYVDMDCEGYVTVDPENMSMVKGSGHSNIPYSMKVGSYESSSPDVSGVAIECDGEVCTMVRGETDPVESVYSRVNKPSNSVLKAPISYPIVSLKALQTDAKNTEASVKRSHDRMRNIMFGQTRNGRKNLIDATQDLKDEVDRFDKTQNVVAAKLYRTMSKLEEIRDTYIESIDGDKDKMKLEAVNFNLRKRNDLTADLLKLSDSVTSRINKIREIQDEIRSLNDLADRMFANVEYVYEE